MNEKKKCIICGKEVEQSIVMDEVLCSRKCFNESFWNEALDETSIIINGTCYHDGGKFPSGYKGFLGYAGRKFSIQMNDGAIIETNNLCCNGTVPKERNIKDNAKFIPVNW